MSDIEASTWSEAAASNNAATPNGWPEGMNPSAVNDCAREFMGAVKRDWNRSHATISSTGSANAYVLTHTTAPAAYINGQQFAFIASFANTGSATANVDGLGAKTINKHGGAGLSALSSGDIQIGHHVTLEYDSSANVLVLISPTPAGSGVGTMAAQDSNNVNISGGTIAGIVDLAVADGGTGRSTLANHGVLVGQGTGGVNSTGAGTAGQVLTSNGGAADPTFQNSSAAAGQLVGVQTFTSSGTYSRNAAATKATIVARGPGGAGGAGTSSGPGGGGGQGALAIAFLKSVGSTETVTINSSTSTFGSWAVAGAGSAGGNGSSGVGGVGGAASTGDQKWKGAPGGSTNDSGSGNGPGGSGGGEGGGAGGANNSTGGDAGNYGAGGGGGGGAAPHSGGTGSTGIITVYEYA